MNEARFFPGQQVSHLLFDYRGLVFDVDSSFAGSQQWYESMAKSRPPKDAPWYHVLVHGADHTTYVAERNLTAFNGTEFIDHPMLPNFFDGFNNGVYRLRKRAN